MRSGYLLFISYSSAQQGGGEQAQEAAAGVPGPSSVAAADVAGTLNVGRVDPIVAGDEDPHVEEGS